MNPLDALLVPPALVKRALDDLHELAELARRYAGREADIVARADRLEDELRAMPRVRNCAFRERLGRARRRVNAGHPRESAARPALTAVVAVNAGHARRNRGLPALTGVSPEPTPTSPTRLLNAAVRRHPLWRTP